MPPLPLPDGLRPPLDPRDEPGRDDHDRLIHPHGNSLWFPWPYALDDLESYVRACIKAHRALSVDYLAHAEREPMPPLCRSTHVEVLAGGVGDLPHSMRPICTSALAAIEQTTGQRFGQRFGLLRTWRHFGTDCEAAEAWRCGDPVHP